LGGDALNVQKAPILTTRKSPVILCVDTMHITLKEDATVTLGSLSWVYVVLLVKQVLSMTMLLPLARAFVVKMNSMMVRDAYVMEGFISLMECVMFVLLVQHIIQLLLPVIALPTKNGTQVCPNVSPSAPNTNIS
jgi:hypothetical protein